MRRPASVALVLAVALIARTSEGHVGPRVIPVYEIPTSDIPDLHDGTLEDWDDIVPGPSLTHKDFGTGWANEYIVDAGDLAFRIFLAWHLGTQRLYGAIEMVDDVYFNRGTFVNYDYSWLYHSDCWELLVDGDHSGGAFFPPSFRSSQDLYSLHPDLMMVEAQRYTAVAEPIGSELNSQRLGLFYYQMDAWFLHPPYADAGGHVTDEQPVVSVSEISVTLWDKLDVRSAEKSVATTLSPDQIVGFDVFVFDWDGGKEGEGFLIFGDGNVANANGFKDGILMPCFRDDCSRGEATPSAIETDSWGRIKASLW